MPDLNGQERANERAALNASWNRHIHSRGRGFPNADAGFWHHNGFEAGYRAALTAREGPSDRTNNEEARDEVG